MLNSITPAPALPVPPAQHDCHRPPQALCPSVALPPVHPAQVHSKIRTEPVKPKKKPNKPAQPKLWLPRKLTYEQRKANLKAKLNALAEADDE